MKNILLIIIISVYTSSFSQVKIDTSEIKSIRYEWKLNDSKNDSTLNQILTEYNSGIYKEEFTSVKTDNHEYPFINIFEPKFKYLNRDQKSGLKVHYWSAMNGFQRNYYNKFGILDSVYFVYKKDSLKEFKKNTIQKYRRKGKLDYLINENNEKEVYTYNLFGKLKRIDVYKDSVLYEINTFKNGLLIKQKYPTREKYRKQFEFEYDKKGRLILRDDSDTELYKYEYNEFGLSKSEKILKSKNMIIEYSIFIYVNQGLLRNKKEYRKIGGKERLLDEYNYTYK
ncbi:MAG: hypothetical protein GY739_08520 [Mesoflavibacter sp.]|nr:hypothetical protein [Mesoflavibacter sp.]